MKYANCDESFDVLVIGAGHAGCEAASAAARMGAQTALVTLNLDLIGQMSCNPAIGGVAKGHLVREMDALGGIMGRVIDRTGIQFRLLNRSRGPAVQSPRAQADRALYRMEMRNLLENTPNLHLRQGVVVDLLVDDGAVYGIELQDSRRIHAKAVIVATGTFLNGLIHTGKRTYAAGRAGEPASTDLANSLRRLSFPVGRLKTGTPPRLDGRTIDWDSFEPQPADITPVPFSFSTESIKQPQINCFVGYTDEHVHQAIRDNLHESPLYSGQIKGIGPRYCPSIEDKVVKFPDKTRHQLFLEPEGFNTHEVYLNGFSTSLPSDLQFSLVHRIRGLEEAQIIRPGYAIEYDFVDPRELTLELETLRVRGLFLAGQINGTTGYEEAGCQGLVAGINAACSVLGRESFRLTREESYVGVLLSDLISNGVDEPYRMFTSRAENRLSLRYDTADARLSPYGRALGLVDDEHWELYNKRRGRLASIRNLLHDTRIGRSTPQYSQLVDYVGSEINSPISLAHLALRPGIEFSWFANYVDEFSGEKVSVADLTTVYADIIYSGYIDSQRSANQRVNQNDGLTIPQDFSFRDVGGLSHEMIERFYRSRPHTFGDARRLPGITPAALAALLVRLKLKHIARV